VRLVYLGTPDAAVPPLRALVAAGHDIAFAVTQPDRRRSRRGSDEPSPVKRAALELGVPVLTPNKASEVVEDVAASGAEAGVVVAFGQLLRPALLDALPLGFVNLHFSLLPRWRGAAPVERAILAGDTETGVCLMRIDEGLDTGPVYECARVPITATSTAGDLRAALVARGVDVLLEHLPHLAALTPRPQEGAPTYADKVAVEDFRLDPQRSAGDLARVVRAGDPHPGAWFRAGGSRYKVFGPTVIVEPAPAPGVVQGDVIGTTDGALRFAEVQPEGKRRMATAEWRRGHPDDLVVEP
jgi:methionyl-tRNA formyltransferase